MYVSPQHPLNVAQLPGGYVFNSVKYARQHVYSQGWMVGRQYTNPGLGNIEEMWEGKGHSAHKARGRPWGGITVNQNRVVHPPPPSLNSKGWPCPESLVGVDPSVLGGSVVELRPSAVASELN